MLILSNEEKNTLKKIISDTMGQSGILRGEYDAVHGDEHFMLGIATLLDYLAYSVDDEFGKEVESTFIKNMIKSEKKALTDS
jgi:hypothetical protein